MTTKIPTKKMEAYGETARRRRQQKEQALTLRKAQFGAEWVVAFGSLLSTKRFRQHSDVDLAVWGLDEKLYYRAVSRLLDLDSDISIDLIEVEFASPTLQTVIQREGVSL